MFADQPLLIDSVELQYTWIAGENHRLASVNIELKLCARQTNAWLGLHDITQPNLRQQQEELGKCDCTRQISITDDHSDAEHRGPEWQK